MLNFDIESHGVINTISYVSRRLSLVPDVKSYMHSAELDKSYESFMTSTRLNSTKSYSQSPRASYHPLPQTGNGTGMSKLPPTGPRAYKKPRLSEAQASPPRIHTTLPPHKSHSKSHPPARGHDTRDYARRLPEGRGKPNHIKMDIEEDSRAIPPSPSYDRERERERDRERERGSKERDRDGGRERDGNRHTRRNSSFAGRGGGGPARRAERVLAPIDSFAGGDRTLAERMGL